MVCSIEILLAVLLVVGFMLLLWLLVEFLDWNSGISSTAPILTFNAFEKLYALNPSKWNFYPNYVRYCPDGDEYKSMVVEFKHFRDVIRYKLFKNKVEANKEELERIRKEKEFLGYVQNDINTYREENLAEMKRILQK